MKLAGTEMPTLETSRGEFRLKRRAPRINLGEHQASSQCSAKTMGAGIAAM
jgi:hypothetical protein